VRELAGPHRQRRRQLEAAASGTRLTGRGDRGRTRATVSRAGGHQATEGRNALRASKYCLTKLAVLETLGSPLDLRGSAPSDNVKVRSMR
jgi:hypothetical protein